MTDFTKVRENLERRGYTVRCFAGREEAAAYLDGAVDGATVGFGGSVTLDQMGLYARLRTHNTVFAHWYDGAGNLGPAMTAQVYLTSVNGLSEDGVLLNIDGRGNRVASTLFGHERVYFVVGRNKLAPTYDEALWRARNIAAPKNAQRLGKKTPCALRGDRCYDCKSPERICRGLVVLWEAMLDVRMEVLLIDEELGY